jgi:release factor glutamine methyltransferase
MSAPDKNYVELTREFLLRNRLLGDHLFELDGHVFEVAEDVFSPQVFGDAAFFAREIPPRVGASLLEVGCGAGVISIAAALAGCDRVLATDVNPAAAANTARNAARLGVGATLETRCGDLFEALSDMDRFESIFWNPPFIPIAGDPEDCLEISVFDDGYRSLRRYLAGAERYLTPGGRLYFGFSSSSGDITRLRAIASELGLELCLRASTEVPDPVHSGFWLELYEARRQLE